MKMLTLRYRPWVVYAACSLAALSILTSNLRGGFLANYVESSLMTVLSPMNIALDWCIESSISFFHHYIMLVDLREENEKLIDELENSHRQEVLLEEYSILTNRYRELLGFTETFHHQTLMADVVQKHLDSWNTVFTINAGSYHGIHPAMGVINKKGVIGQVTLTAPLTSKVISIMNPQCGVAAIMQQSRISGIVTGSGQGDCIMKYASHFDRIVLGETVLTSGFDDVFEKNIPIGQVSRIEKIPGEIFQRIQIIPFVDFSEVENVILILPRNPESSE
jgi:rod shape-determining protein MreC